MARTRRDHEEQKTVATLQEVFEIAVPTADQVFHALLRAALNETNGHVAQAAGLIGVSVKTAYNWRNKYQIEGN